MFSRIIPFVVIALCMLSLTSCKKEIPQAEPGTTSVEIIIASPTNGQTLNALETISIDGRIEANAEMGSWSITITDSDSGELLNRHQQFYTQTLYIVHHHWTPKIDHTHNVNFKVEAFNKDQDLLASESIEAVVKVY